ncbi:MAG: DUF748 domain-containing protein [Bdellovibrionota bacterium]
MKLMRGFLIIILILGAIRLMIPVVALTAINYVLKNKIEDYVGRAEDIDLAFIRGAAQLSDLHLERKDKPETLKIDIAAMKFNFSWQDFWEKKIIANLHIEKLEVVLTELPPEKPPQPDDLTFVELRKILAESEWSSKINKFEIRNSSVKFVVPKAKAPLSISNIDVDIQNLHFSPDTEWQLANVKVRGLLQGQAEINLNGKLQPLAMPPMADLNFSLVDFDLKTLNGLLLKVLPMDITRGKLSTYIEAASEKGYSNGYAKVFFDEIDVVASKQKFKSGRHFLIEAGAGFGNWLLKNSKEKSVAISVPFKIKHGDVDVDKSDAFWSTITNKRDEIDRKFENSIGFAQNRNEILMK